MTEPAGELVTQSDALIQVIERASINPDVDIDKMERLLSLKERLDAKQAEQDFNAAMTRSQIAMPIIEPDHKNEQTRSMYAKYDTINKAIKPVYTNEGFSLCFGQAESKTEGYIRITCDVSHTGGHSKLYFMDLPPDMTGLKGTQNKTGVHGTASTFSYGQRYLAKLIFNLTISEEDDDGNAAGGDTRSAMEVAEEHINYMGLVRELFPSIAMIKEGIAVKNYSLAIEALNELTDNEKQSIWKAPTKGGVFTTNERTVMKSNEWAEARRENINE